MAAEAEQQRRMEEAEQRRRALAEGGEDSELPGAEAPPLAAKAVPGTAQLLPADLPGELCSSFFQPSAHGIHQETCCDIGVCY